MTTILFDATRLVKPARKARPVGTGILASAPHHNVTDHTADDERWLIADNARRDVENRRLEWAAGEAAAVRRHELGLCL